GYYALVEGNGSEAIYRRTELSASEYNREPRLFTENLAHPANVRRASLDGQPVPYPEIPHRFDFLRQATGWIGFTGRYTFDVQFGDTELDISELAVGDADATGPASLIFELQAATGDVQFATQLDLEASVPRQVFIRFPATSRASRLHVTMVSPPVQTNVRLHDV